MRQFIITFNLFGSFVIFALVTNLFEQAVMFVLFGFIPGIDEPLSPNQMLGIYGLASLGVATHVLHVRLRHLLRHFAHAGMARRSKAA
jgi:hypothetical protein